MAPDLRLDAFRIELGGYCYRMLGSPFETEDAVQETLLRAWRNFDRFDEGRAALRPWLYKIATNVCLDMLRSPQRRARAMDMGPSSSAGSPLGTPLSERSWILPIPDRLVLAADLDPAELAAQRDAVRLAFIALLQRLPPRQRAVLILRVVLCWRADEVAQLLDTTVASVTSALQRARLALAAADVAMGEPLQRMDDTQRDLLARYCDAFERYDVEALVSLLHEDATMSMPPFSWWLRGREEIRRALLGAGRPCGGSRLIATVANGSPAFGQYLPSETAGIHKAFALVVIELSEGSIRETTSYLEAERLFTLFGLPTELWD